MLLRTLLLAQSTYRTVFFVCLASLPGETAAGGGKGRGNKEYGQSVYVEGEKERSKEGPVLVVMSRHVVIDESGREKRKRRPLPLITEVAHCIQIGRRGRGQICTTTPQRRGIALFLPLSKEGIGGIPPPHAPMSNHPSERPWGKKWFFWEGSRKKLVRRKTRKSIEGMGKRSLVSRLCSLEILHHHLSVQSGSSLSLSESSHSLPLLPSPTTFNGPSVNESRASAAHRREWGGVGVHLWESGGGE